MAYFHRATHLSSRLTFLLAAALFLRAFLTPCLVLASPISDHSIIKTINEDQSLEVGLPRTREENGFENQDYRSALLPKVETNAEEDPSGQSNLRKLLVRQVNRKELASNIAKNMITLKKDQSVFPLDKKYFNQAKAYAQNTGKISYLNAWSNEFWFDTLNGNDDQIYEIVMIFWQVFISKSSGTFRVFGKPGENGQYNSESAILMGTLFPMISRNPNIKSVIVVDPSTKIERKIANVPTSSETVASSDAGEIQKEDSSRSDPGNRLASLETSQSTSENPLDFNMDIETR